MQLQWPNKLDEASFLQQYWQTRPLLIRQAFPDIRTDNPLTRDELGGLALEQDINSRIILRENDKQWHCRTGPFDAAELEELPAKDWTLLVSDVEKHLPELRQWIKPFHFIPQWRIDDLMISYAPTGASVGPHIDNYDVFLLQAAGTREWSITENPEADRRLIEGLDIGVLDNFNAEETYVLEPGDMLYLPPDVPHHGIALDDECMTWSIGFRAPSHREIVTDIAERLAAKIPEEAFYSDPGILLHEHSGQISPNVVTRIREIWNTYVHPDSEEFEQLVGHLLTNGTAVSMAGSETGIGDDNTHDGNPEAAVERVRSLLQSSEQWERNSFVSLAFIPVSSLDDAAEKPAQKVLNKIKETVSRTSTSADDDAEGTAATEKEALTGDGSDNNESATPGNPVRQVTLYVDGTAMGCSESLATALTSDFDYPAEALLGQCGQAQDYATLEWLAKNEVIQPV